MMTIERSARSLLTRKEGRSRGCCWHFPRKCFESIEDISLIHFLQWEILKIEGLEVLLIRTLVVHGDIIL